MQKLFISIMSVSIMLVSMLVSGVVYASDDAHFIVGEKYGNAKFKNSVGNLVDDDHGNSLLLGYDFGSGIAAQFELTRINGDLASTGGNGSYDEKTHALYLAYRSPGNLYFLVKGGYLWEEMSMTRGAVSSTTDDNTVSGGVGAGYNFGRISLEAEYTRMEQNLYFMSVGFNFNF